jgi:hypothetical protein
MKFSLDPRVQISLFCSWCILVCSFFVSSCPNSGIAIVALSADFVSRVGRALHQVQTGWRKLAGAQPPSQSPTAEATGETAGTATSQTGLRRDALVASAVGGLSEAISNHTLTGDPTVTQNCLGAASDHPRSASDRTGVTPTFCGIDDVETEVELSPVLTQEDL